MLIKIVTRVFNLICIICARNLDKWPNPLSFISLGFKRQRKNDEINVGYANLESCKYMKCASLYTQYHRHHAKKFKWYSIRLTFSTLNYLSISYLKPYILWIMEGLDAMNIEKSHWKKHSLCTIRVVGLLLKPRFRITVALD